MTEKCCDPNHKIEKCYVCGSDVHTCEKEDPTDEGDYTCPAHPDGIELRNGSWVCSIKCWGDYHKQTNNLMRI